MRLLSVFEGYIFILCDADVSLHFESDYIVVIDSNHGIRSPHLHRIRTSLRRTGVASYPNSRKRQLVRGKSRMKSVSRNLTLHFLLHPPPARLIYSWTVVSTSLTNSRGKQRKKRKNDPPQKKNLPKERSKERKNLRPLMKTK